jgi:hypothetical protein
MNRKRDVVRKHASAGLAMLMLTLSVAVPIMERGELVADTAVESEHDPARCGHPHDHRVCAQVGANLSLAAPAHEVRLSYVVISLARPDDLQSTVHKRFLAGPPSRAPPLA